MKQSLRQFEAFDPKIYSARNDYNMSEKLNMSDFLQNQALEAIQRDAWAARERQERIAGRFDAEDTLKYLISRVREFEEEIPEDHEVGLKLANLGVSQTIHIRSISARNPNIIEFAGVLPDGEDATLVQHLSQLNFLMISVPPVEENEPYRIGFEVTPK